QVHVGHGETHRRDAGAGNKAGAKPGFLDQSSAHAVAATGHDLDSGLVEKRLHRGGLGTHGASFISWWSDHLIAQRLLATPEPHEIVAQDLDHIVLVTPGLASGVRGEEHMLHSPKRRVWRK